MGWSRGPNDIEKICINCSRNISDHPSTGRFHSIILHGRECAWNPDSELRGFVVNTLRNSGFDVEDFGYK